MLSKLSYQKQHKLYVISVVAIFISTLLFDAYYLNVLFTIHMRSIYALIIGGIEKFQSGVTNTYLSFLKIGLINYS